MSFQFHALPADKFTSLFSMSDKELSANNARRVLVDEFPGTPCRISLEDAKVGEQVILVHYEHQPENTPYKAGHAIFVRENVARAQPEKDEVPALFRHRLMSLRAFSSEHLMLDAEVVEGTALEQTIQALFSNRAVEYIHLHNAKPGCYAALITRSTRCT